MTTELGFPLYYSHWRPSSRRLLLGMGTVWVRQRHCAHMGIRRDDGREINALVLGCLGFGYSYPYEVVEAGTRSTSSGVEQGRKRSRPRLREGRMS